MVTFHINGNGDSGECLASNGKCPFGGAEIHYASREIAREAYEKSMGPLSLSSPVRRASVILGDPKALAPHLKTWRESRGNPSSKEEAFARESFGISGEQLLELMDIARGVTLPRDREELERYTIYLRAHEQGPYIGVYKMITRELLARLTDKPGGNSWENRTKLIRFMHKLIELARAEDESALNHMKALQVVTARGEKAKNVYALAVAELAKQMRKEDIAHLESNYRGGSLSKLRIRMPRTIEPNQNELSQAPGGATLHTIYFSGLPGKGIQQAVHDKQDNQWIDRASGRALNPHELQELLNNELAKTFSSARNILYA